MRTTNLDYTNPDVLVNLGYTNLGYTNLGYTNLGYTHLQD